MAISARVLENVPHLVPVQGEVLDALDFKLRKQLTHVIRQCRTKSRAQIAEEMSRLVGVEISVHMLNAYTAEHRHPARFPAAFIPAFCEVTGDDSLQRLLLGARLLRVLELGERALAAMYKEPRLRLLVEDFRNSEQGLLSF